ncbi:hypothetical protein E2320_001893, partial [Naja naja]
MRVQTKNDSERHYLGKGLRRHRRIFLGKMCSCIKDTVAWLHPEGICFQGGVSDLAGKYIWQIVTIQ